MHLLKRPVMLLVLMAAVIARPHATRTRAQGEGVVVDHDVMLSMRDGVRLAADIYRPAAQGAFPVVLVRTPSNKDSNKDEGAYFAQHGYVYMVQDVRGRYASEGNFDIYVDEGNDGYDSAAWLTSQPWFDPALGFALYGGSYGASTALSAALANPPNLKAMYVYSASANYHEDGAWRGGAFALAHNVTFASQIICPNQLQRSLKPDASDAEKNVLKWDPQTLLGYESATPLDLPILSANCPWYRDWAMNENLDWYWNQPGRNHIPYFSQLPHIPIAFLGGWYDQFLGGTVIDYQAAKTYTGQPTALTIGPWIHGGINVPVAGNGFFGAEAVRDTKADALRWFDHYLKGVSNGVGTEPEVRYFLMGGGTGRLVLDRSGKERLDLGGEWRTAASWPLSDTRYVPYYLHSSGRLDPAVPGFEAPDTYVYDPRNPTPTVGGNISAGGVLAPAGAYDQVCTPDLLTCNGSSAPLNSRSDVLTYQTDPLNRDTAVVGPLSMQLWAASSAVDTDFTAKLVDVYPDGTAVNIEDGIIRARYRNQPLTPELLTPGQTYEFTIDLWPTANLFKAGHRIRVDISSSNFPHFDRNLNTGNPIGSDVLDNAIAAEQTILHDSLHPSNLVLPLVSLSAAK